MYETRKPRGAAHCCASTMAISSSTASAEAEALHSVHSLNDRVTGIQFIRELAGINVTMNKTTTCFDSSSCMLSEMWLDATSSSIYKTKLPTPSKSRDHNTVGNANDRGGNVLIRAFNSLILNTLNCLKIQEAAIYYSPNGTRGYQPPLLADNIPTGMKLEGAPPRLIIGVGITKKHICSSTRKGEMNKCAIA
ncbi:MAG: hypothetical protein SVY53_07655 [Chloroflexota bacterium]|nr:hypothetical protein [Chloroflexota bacterium]